MPLAPLAESSGHDELAQMSVWSPGDHWNWKKEPTSARGSVSTGNLTWHVQARENITMDMWEPGDDPAWRTQDVLRIHSWQNKTLPTEQTTIDVKQENVVHRRVADQALVRSNVDDRFVISLPNGSTEEGHTERNVERYAPLIELQFPFAVGDAWRVRTEQRHVLLNNDDCGGPGQASCRGGGPAAFTYSVAARERLTLTLNGESVTMDTWRLKVTDETTGRQSGTQAYEIWWYAEEACNVVLREQYSETRQKVGILTLTDYQCAGGQAPDPDYSGWDYEQFSSTRFHGALSEDALKGLRRSSPPFFSPGIELPLAALGLVAAAGLMRRRLG